MLLIELIEIFGVSWLDLASESMMEDDENDVGWLERFLRFGDMIEFVDIVYVNILIKVNYRSGQK